MYTNQPAEVFMPKAAAPSTEWSRPEADSETGDFSFFPARLEGGSSDSAKPHSIPKKQRRPQGWSPCQKRGSRAVRKETYGG